MTYTPDRPYVPRVDDLAGVTLFGRRQEDGTINVGSDIVAAINMPTFPEYIEVGGAKWALEGVTENTLPADAPPNHSGRGIVWGEYV
jgi:hypothetical protein